MQAAATGYCFSTENGQHRVPAVQPRALPRVELHATLFHGSRLLGDPGHPRTQMLNTLSNGADQRLRVRCLPAS
jgi:hypothetical protein